MRTPVKKDQFCLVKKSSQFFRVKFVKHNQWLDRHITMPGQTAMRKHNARKRTKSSQGGRQGAKTKISKSDARKVREGHRSMVSDGDFLGSMQKKSNAQKEPEDDTADELSDGSDSVNADEGRSNAEKARVNESEVEDKNSNESSDDDDDDDDDDDGDGKGIKKASVGLFQAKVSNASSKAGNERQRSGTTQSASRSMPPPMKANGANGSSGSNRSQAAEFDQHRVRAGSFSSWTPRR